MLIVVALVLAFTRWSLVARAASIEVPIGEAIRLGAIGFACNFVSLGNVGGDVVKATLLAKPRPGKRAAAVTTVVVDRLLGLLGFLLFAAFGIVWTGAATGEPAAPLTLLSRATLAAAVAGTTAFAAVVTPGRPLERLAGGLSSVPVIGPLASRVASLAATYRGGWRSLLAALAVGLSVNGVFILSFCAAAASLPLATPSLAEHFFAVPLALIAGALPISPNGLGTFEAAMDFLYRALQPATPAGVGAVAALAHRLGMLGAGLLGAAYYYASGSRRLVIEGSPASATNSSDEGSGAAEAR